MSVPEGDESIQEVEEVTEEETKPTKKREIVLVERKVIEEKLIRDAVVEEQDNVEAGTVMKEEINLQEITSLMLSFKNIFFIDNLKGFERLTKLQLDNNIIEEITNLDHLVNLQWLDLSFNNITKIDNLDKLVNLSDLSLFNNKITKISGLDKLTKLNVLSLGNNEITELEDIRNLRDFRNLRLLNLKGNPVCKEDDYHNTVFAYLTTLKYLDYELIESSQFQKAKDSKLGDQLVELEEKEKIRAKHAKEGKKESERQALLVEANIPGMEAFFDQIMEEDEQSKTIMKLPGSVKIIQQYRAKWDESTKVFIDNALAEHVLKKDEESLFKSVFEKLLTETEDESISKIQAFEARKKKVFKAYKASVADGEQNAVLLEDLKAEVDALYDELMNLEMLLVEQLNDIIDEFAETYSEFVTKNMNGIANCFRELTENAGWYTESITTLVTRLIEKVNKEEKPFEDQMEVYQLLSDRDAIKSAVTTSNDNHIGALQLKEDACTEAEKGTAKRLIEGFRQTEYERNRHRVSEITELTKSYHSTIDERLDFDAIDEDDFRYGDDGY